MTRVPWCCAARRVVVADDRSCLSRSKNELFPHHPGVLNIMSRHSQYRSFLKSIGPFSSDAIIRVVADLRYGFGAWLRGPDTREMWKARILRHMLLTYPPATHSASASDSAPAPSAGAPTSADEVCVHVHALHTPNFPPHTLKQGPVMGTKRACPAPVSSSPSQAHTVSM